MDGNPSQESKPTEPSDCQVRLRSATQLSLSGDVQQKHHEVELVELEGLDGRNPSLALRSPVDTELLNPREVHGRLHPLQPVALINEVTEDFRL